MSKIRKVLNKRNTKDPNTEMSFIDHIEELRWHIVRSLVAIMICGIALFINTDIVFDTIILGPTKTDFITYKIMCKLAEILHLSSLCMQEINLEFQNTELSGQFMMSFSVSFMLGFIVAFPYIFWEFWRFVKPALSTNELRQARGIVFWSSLLFFLGVLFAYYIIAPFTINFFANYTLSPVFKNIITMKNYYDTLSDLVLGVGIVFELPVIVYFLSKIGLLTPAVMRGKRRIAALIIIVVAAVITPPDVFSLFLVSVPMFMLYEVSINISERANKDYLKRRD